MGKNINTRESIWWQIITYGLEFIGLHYSSYRGFVINNEDPGKMNRLQLRIPHLNELSDDDTWAWPKNVWGGKDYGVQMLPQKGDMVWVEFENGNPDYPIWSHAGYGEEELPTEFKTKNHYGFKTPNGNIILINDNKGEEEILVKHKSSLDWYKLIKDEFELESKLIKLGKNGEEQALMGNTTKDKLDAILEKLDNNQQILIQHTHTTPVGPSGPPIQASDLTQVKTDLQTIKGELPEILSNKVKIDK